MEALGSVSRLTMKIFGFRTVLSIALLLLLATGAQAQQAKMSLEYSEGMFSLITAINACGYDQDLADSMPVREQIRTEVQRAANNPDAQEAMLRLCKFYNDHNPGESSRNLAQYVSLGLSLGEAPAFELKIKEADLAPDANYVLGIVPLLQNFYITTELHKIWLKHKPEYEKVIARQHDPVNELLVSTDLYLRRTMSNYLGHDFKVIMEPMIAPAQKNARNYGDDYFVVLSPNTKGDVQMDYVRHTYLHFILDPMMLKRANELQRLSPLLNVIKDAPLDESYKTDMSLLVTESLIQAIEARQIGARRGPEEPRQQYVDHAMREGFVLTRYFYECLERFEKSDEGFQQGFADWLHYADPQRELKRARDVQFLPAADVEVVGRNRRPLSFTDLAERALASGNPDAASTFAKQALARHQDEGHAYFILARVATMTNRADDASSYFQQSLERSKDPKEIAWAHVYLGRILDLKSKGDPDDQHAEQDKAMRDEAVKHYRAALDTPNAPAEAKTAAQAGVEKPYEPKRKEPSKQ